jgi:hypothetical protein
MNKRSLSLNADLSGDYMTALRGEESAARERRFPVEQKSASVEETDAPGTRWKTRQRRMLVTLASRNDQAPAEVATRLNASARHQLQMKEK